MSLRTRKIASYLKPLASDCATKLNSKFESEFDVQIDWSIVTERDADSGWTEEEIKRSFYTTYFRPLEQALDSVWGDELYREAITEQISTIKLCPDGGRGMFLDISYEDGALLLTKDLHSGRDPENEYMGTLAKQGILDTIEKSLS